MFLDRLLEVLARLAPESDAGEAEAFRTRIGEYRQAIHDQDRRVELPQTTDACIAICRAYLESSRTYHAERQKEFTEVIAILRDAAKLAVADSSDFHAQILASSDRFTQIAELDNIRELRRLMAEEVDCLRTVVTAKRRKDEQAYDHLTSRVDSLEKQLAEMEMEVTLDPLTKVGNRRRFEAALDRARTSHKSGASLALAMIDVDLFKAINDTHGHPIGDRVLVCVAEWIAKSVRQTDVVARYGGEEFAVLLPNATASEVEPRFRRLLADIAANSYEYDLLNGKEQVRFTVSCGLVDICAAETGEALMTRADEALYEAKKKGRNRVITRRRSLLERAFAWA